MKKTSFNITFITPCFCRGADMKTPEIRPPSIRGQLRWWLRALGANPDEERKIFGGVGKETTSSKIVVRTRAIQSATQPTTQPAPILPHKSGPKIDALAPGFSFELQILRRGDLNQKLEDKFEAALQAWLLLGTLGLRSTRAAGSFLWDGQPKTPDEYAKRIEVIRSGTEILAGLSQTKFKTADEARKTASDTLSLAEFDRPLGGIKPRKTSPLRFRVVKFPQEQEPFRIAVVWDGRREVAGNSRANLSDAVRKLCESGKKIGGIVGEALEKSL